MSKIKILILLGMILTGANIIGCSDTQQIIEFKSPFKSFILTCNDKNYHGRIDVSSAQIRIGTIKHSSEITRVSCILEDGVTISPDPQSLIGKWGPEKIFTVTTPTGKTQYTVLLTAYEPEPEEPAPSNVIFEDNFDQEGRIPDETKWSLCPRQTPPWAKYLSESYDQAYVENGRLVIRAEKIGTTYKTGGIQTLGKFDFTYGKVEVCAKFTKTAKGGWPAIWMMPSSSEQEWPRGGEIDIMEQLNHDTYVYHTIHSHYKNDLGNQTPNPTATSKYTKDAFNVYAVEWTPESLTFSVNGKTNLVYPNLHLEDESEKRQWPFNQNFYLILNYALGGPDTWPGYITDSQLPAMMEIDWVKITKLDK